MKEKFIKSYVNQLTKNDIINFALKQNIVLTPNEIDYIYDNIKNNLDFILNNPQMALKKAKGTLNQATYNKVYELYTIYYPKLYH